MSNELEPGAQTVAQTERPTEVFISYSSHDRDKVEKLAHALEKSGFAVWWDRALVPGDSYEQSIEVALKQARAVIVCWSYNAVTSDWVRSEADDARLHGKLLPVFIEEIDLPKPFDRIHTENLIGWRGNRDHHSYQELEEAVRARIEGRAPKVIPWRRKWITRGALVSVLAMVGVAAANVSLIKDIFFPAETLTAADVEQLLADALAKASQQGMELDEDSLNTLRDTLASVMRSTDADKAVAREALLAGRVEDAADSLADVARKQAEAATGAVAAAAQSYKEAGALYAATDTQQAITAYRESLKLVDDDPEAMNRLGHLLERTGNIEEARQLYEQIGASAGATDPIWKAKSLGNLALLDEERGDWRGALEKINEANEIFKAEGDELSVAKALINLGQILTDAEQWDEARNYSERGLALSRQIESKVGEATALANLGYLEMMLNNFDESRRQFAAAAEIMDQEGLKTERGAIYINLSRMASIEDDFDEAEVLALKALEIAREMKAKLAEGGAYNLLGNVARDRGNFDEAELYQNKALKIFEALEMPRQIELQHRAMGRTAEVKGDLDGAIARFEQALAVIDGIEAPRLKADTVLSLSQLHAKAGRLDKAMELAEDSAALFDEIGHLVGLGDAVTLQARIARAADDAQGAVNTFAAAKDIYVQAERPVAAAQSMINVGEIAFQYDDPNVAKLAFDEARALLPESGPANLRSYTMLSASEARMMLGEVDEAVALAETNLAFVNAIEDAPNLPVLQSDAILLLARIANALGDADEATTRFNEAAAILREAGGEANLERAAQIDAERDAE